MDKKECLCMLHDSARLTLFLDLVTDLRFGVLRILTVLLITVLFLYASHKRSVK